MIISPTLTAPGYTTDGLVAWLDPGHSGSFPGSGSTWANLITGGSDATLTGPTYSTAGGGCFSFDGTNDYAAMTRPVSTDFTLSCWFKTTQSVGATTHWYDGVGLLDCEMAGTAADFALALTGGKPTFGTDGGTYVSIQSEDAYNDDGWHHVAATRDNTSGAVVLYVDGVQVDSGTGATDTPLTAASDMKIGAVRTLVRYYEGSIAQVFIYSTPLNAAQVAAAYNSTRSRYGV